MKNKLFRLRCKCAPWGLMLAIALTSASCKSKYIYLEDLKANTPERIVGASDPRVKPLDRLAITITCQNPELAAMFNAAGKSDPSNEGSQSAGFLVDRNGQISLPILGKVDVAGLTTEEVSAKMVRLLIDGQYIPDAFVDTRITNFTVYGLGALKTGKVHVEDGHLTVLEALSMMGDLEERAKVEKVRVIREENGTRTEYDIDLTTKDLYQSPGYHLQQNDIVYAEPKKRTNKAVSSTMTGISILAVLASIAYSVAFILK